LFTAANALLHSGECASLPPEIRMVFGINIPDRLAELGDTLRPAYKVCPFPALRKK
jgi:hypothetical protein